MRLLIASRLRFGIWAVMSVGSVVIFTVNFVAFPVIGSVFGLVVGVAVAAFFLWLALRGAVLMTRDGCRPAAWGSSTPFVPWENVREFRERGGDVLVVAQNGFEFLICRQPHDIWMSRRRHERLTHAFLDRLRRARIEMEAS